MPNNELCKQLLELQQQISFQFGVKEQLKIIPHLTLHAPFLLAQFKEFQLIETIKSIVTYQPIQINPRQASYFQKRVIYLAIQNNTHLMALQKQITLQLKTQFQVFTQSYNSRGYVPHISIVSRGLKPALFNQVLNLVNQKPIHCSYTASELTLFKLINDRWTEFEKIKFI